jgi:carboxypeptidase-like protein
MLRFVLFFLVGLSATAQISGTVTDSLSGKPVPYVNIWVENGTVGATSEENGQFTLSAATGKNLVFSAMGYETKKIKASEALTVRLNPAIFKIEGVIVRRPIYKKEIEIGDSKKIHHTHLSGATPWIYAKFFPYEARYDQTPFLKNAIVFTDSEIKGATFKLRIYEVDSAGFPGMDMVDEDIVISVKKGLKENAVDLSKYNLAMPKNGIFIAYEWLIIESNKYIYTYKDTATGNQEMVTYAPVVVCNAVPREYTFWYSGGKWKQRKQTVYEGKYSNMVIEPAINMTLTN